MSGLRQVLNKRCEFTLDARLQSLNQGGGYPASLPQDSPDSAQSRAGAGRQLLGTRAAPVQEAVMNGTLTSKNCNIALRIGASTYRLDKYFAKAVNYTLMVTALSLVQVRPPGSGAVSSRRAAR